MSAIGSTLAAIRSPSLRTRRARSLTGVAAQPGKAALAAATAALISSWPPLATVSITSPVAGLMVSKVSLLPTFWPLMMCWIMCCSRFLLDGGEIGGVVDDGVDQAADAFDFSFDHVARLDVRQAFRRAGQDDVARIQGHEGRQVFDQRRDDENHVGGRAFLRRLAVDARRQLERHRIGDVVAVDQPGAERRAG